MSPTSLRTLLATLVALSTGAAAQVAPPAVVGDAAPGDVVLVDDTTVADVCVDPADAAVVRIAAGLLADDVERVAGRRPDVRAGDRPTSRVAVIVGTIGASKPIDALIAAGKLDVADVRGRWESSVVATVESPVAGVDRALVIAGSDRRGTAYGVVDLCRRIGVSPWHWWADVPPRHRDRIAVRVTRFAHASPAVKYRGIFLNDEDWGLQPWAAKTFEPESNDIGPKTYARIFELLLRLRANYCWPAMHPSTRAFNTFERNARMADDYAIVMGSSHAEPMLRNNVGEWKPKTMGEWNPVTNLPAIRDYWEARVRANGTFENVYTVGMRGVHDSGMPGGGTLAEKRDRLQSIIDLQRALLAKHVNADPSAVPQIFCPYKETLDIYQSGMRLPGDVTLVWPDDNFGYVRQLPNDAERERAGGSGVYYHLSYWGRPHDYLWLESASPALIWREMTRAYDLGARQLWVANVGDIKPLEASLTFFLDLAWNPTRYDEGAQRTFLRAFYATQFGDERADAIADLKDEYFRLCAVRKPEHLGFNRVYFSRATPNTPVEDGDWTDAQAAEVLARWRELSRRAAALADDMPAASRDAFFQLVEYPALAGAAMAEKTLKAREARRTGSPEAAAAARAALDRIGELTDRYNAQGDGKWRGMMNDRPRRLPVFEMPPTTAATSRPAPTTASVAEAAIDLAAPARAVDRDGVGWRMIEGLGPRGRALAVLPQRPTPTLRTPGEIRDRAPAIAFALPAGLAGDVAVTVEALPTHPATPAHEIVAALSIDDGEPTLVRFDAGADDENDRTWQRNVLRGAMSGTVRLRVPAGARALTLWAADAGVVVQRIAVTAGER